MILGVPGPSRPSTYRTRPGRWKPLLLGNGFPHSSPTHYLFLRVVMDRSWHRFRRWVIVLQSAGNRRFVSTFALFVGGRRGFC